MNVCNICGIVLTQDTCFPSYLKIGKNRCKKCESERIKKRYIKRYPRSISTYHQRKIKKCPYCEKERKRFINATGRNKGYQRTCGSKECILASYRRPEVVAKKIHRGPDHPNWIPDRSKVKFRPRYEMTSWKRAVFERDNFICQKCGQRGGRLQAHHNLPYASFPEQRWDVANGVTLCVDCHKQTESYGKKAGH